MNKLKYLLLISVLLQFIACSRSRELSFAENPDLKIVISTVYSFEDNIESYYYEFQTISGTPIISKTWFLARSSYNEIDLNEFKTGKNESIIYLKFNKAAFPDRSIVFAYNLQTDKLLKNDEISAIFEED